VSDDPHGLRERYAALASAPRLPPIDPDRLTPEQRAVWDSYHGKITPDPAEFAYVCSLYGVGDPLARQSEIQQPNP
jgi:hypothetical protein